MQRLSWLEHYLDMGGVPGSSPVAPTRDLENNVGNECRNDSDCADGDGEHLNGIASK